MHIVLFFAEKSSQMGLDMCVCVCEIVYGEQ